MVGCFPINLHKRSTPCVILFYYVLSIKLVLADKCWSTFQNILYKCILGFNVRNIYRNLKAKLSIANEVFGQSFLSMLWFTPGDPNISKIAGWWGILFNHVFLGVIITENSLKKKVWEPKTDNCSENTLKEAEHTFITIIKQTFEGISHTLAYIL